MGKMVYYQKNKERGYELIEEAIRLMEEADYKYKFDNLRYNLILQYLQIAPNHRRRHGHHLIRFRVNLNKHFAVPVTVNAIYMELGRTSLIMVTDIV